MGKIVAIGGGSIGSNGTLYETKMADLEIVRLSNSNSPSILYIGFANNNNELLRNRVRTIFETYTRCSFHVLEPQDLQSPDALNSKIDRSDIIYVSGGDSYLLMEIMMKSPLARALEAAYNSNKVLSGISAGAICWFKYGCSALEQQSVIHDSEHIPHCVTGLNLLDSLFCPHYHNDQRKEYLNGILRRTPNLTAIGLDQAALVINETIVRIIPLAESAVACKLRFDGQSIVQESLLLNHTYHIDNFFG